MLSVWIMQQAAYNVHRCIVVTINLLTISALVLMKILRPGDEMVSTSSDILGEEHTPCVELICL